MTETHTLIDQLATDATPRSRARPWRMFGIWVVSAISYIALVMAFYLHPRPDLMTKFHEPLFMAEIITLVALALSALFSAAALSFPDQYQYRRMIYLPIIIFVIFWAVMATAWHLMVAANPPMPAGMECLVCITMLSVLPALLIFYQIRNMASTRPAAAGTAAALAAFGIGAITLRLSEYTDSITHLVVWHYAPMLAAAAMGVILGRKLFQW